MPSDENRRRAESPLYGLLRYSSVLTLVLGIPLIGRLILGSVLLGLAVLALLMLIQLPFFAPVWLLERARKRREIEQIEFDALSAGCSPAAGPPGPSTRSSG
jgi:hypothetical protein